MTHSNLAHLQPFQRLSVLIGLNVEPNWEDCKDLKSHQQELLFKVILECNDPNIVTGFFTDSDLQDRLKSMLFAREPQNYLWPKDLTLEHMERLGEIISTFGLDRRKDALELFTSSAFAHDRADMLAWTHTQPYFQEIFHTASVVDHMQRLLDHIGGAFYERKFDIMIVGVALLHEQFDVPHAELRDVLPDAYAVFEQHILKQHVSQNTSSGKPKLM